MCCIETTWNDDDDHSSLFGLVEAELPCPPRAPFPPRFLCLIVIAALGCKYRGTHSYLGTSIDRLTQQSPAQS